METWPVRFEFQCEVAAEELKFVHRLPRSLVRAQAQVAQRDPGYADLYMTSVLPIMKEHEAACRDASNIFCENCGSSMVNVLQTPSSWLHNVGDPFVVVWVNPVCEKGECDTRTGQEIKEMMDEFVEGQGHILDSRMVVEITACGICGKTEGTMRCGRCKIASYCWREQSEGGLEGAQEKLHSQGRGEKLRSVGIIGIFPY